MSEKKKNIPDPIITNGTIIGDIRRAIMGLTEMAFHCATSPIAAKVPSPVASNVARIPIIKLFFIDLIHWELFHKSDHQPITATWIYHTVMQEYRYTNVQKKHLDQVLIIPCVKLK